MKKSRQHQQANDVTNFLPDDDLCHTGQRQMYASVYSSGTNRYRLWAESREKLI
jgi:hypothetical protein